MPEPDGCMFVRRGEWTMCKCDRPASKDGAEVIKDTVEGLLEGIEHISRIRVQLSPHIHTNNPSRRYLIRQLIEAQSLVLKVRLQ